MYFCQGLILETSSLFLALRTEYEWQLVCFSYIFLPMKTSFFINKENKKAHFLQVWTNNNSSGTGAIIGDKGNVHRRSTTAGYQMTEYCTSQTSSLQYARNFESRDKLYYCNECPYQSPIKANLERHLHIHTGEKPFACPLCDYRSYEKPKVKRHMQIHKWSDSFFLWVNLLCVSFWNWNHWITFWMPFGEHETLYIFTSYLMGPKGLQE